VTQYALRSSRLGAPVIVKEVPYPVPGEMTIPPHQVIDGIGRNGMALPRKEKVPHGRIVRIWAVSV